VGGTDSDARQLDRREFEETTKTLLWLATSQMVGTKIMALATAKTS
jgi:hypothetical protein